MKYLTCLLLLFIASFSFGQSEDHFNYEISLEPINIEGFNGLHSFAVGQSGTKCLLVGGRRDGIHARQPFNAFPSNFNNDSLFVFDFETKEFWSRSLEDLDSNLQEQLQSTNMNFHQNGDTLIIIGGYAYSLTVDDHISFPYLTMIDVPNTINAIINQALITPYLIQIKDENFAVCGGQLGMIEDYFYLVGGHRFDGRYNPMGHPTYTQTYTDQIRKFQLDFKESEITVQNYEELTDPIHLHRRDYNLLPQIFQDSSFGYTLYSGVFQLEADLPFLYPVHIYKDNIEPIPSFNQYLSNYHSANLSLYDAEHKQMNNLFFGGMSQYYYENNELIEDQNVPFVSTISRVSIYDNGDITEFKLNIEMPLLQGSSAEFVLKNDIPTLYDQIIDLNALPEQETIIGYIIGGIYSAIKNPFSLNNVSNTSADFNIYAVKLSPSSASGVQAINGENPYEMNIFPNPGNGSFQVTIELEKDMDAFYYLTSADSKIMASKSLKKLRSGTNKFDVTLNPTPSKGILSFTLVLDHKYYLTKKIVIAQ